MDIKPTKIIGFIVYYCKWFGFIVYYTIHGFQKKLLTEGPHFVRVSHRWVRLGTIVALENEKGREHRAGFRCRYPGCRIPMDLTSNNWWYFWSDSSRIWTKCTVFFKWIWLKVYIYIFKSIYPIICCLNAHKYPSALFKPLCHPFILFENRTPNSWIVTIPNIMDTIQRPIIFNQQGFWTLLTWWCFWI